MHVFGSISALFFFFWLPPIQCTAPSGERNHGYATVRNDLTCRSVRGVNKRSLVGFQLCLLCCTRHSWPCTGAVGVQAVCMWYLAAPCEDPRGSGEGSERDSTLCSTPLGGYAGSSGSEVLSFGQMFFQNQNYSQLTDCAMSQATDADCTTVWHLLPFCTSRPHILGVGCATEPGSCRAPSVTNR